MTTLSILRPGMFTTVQDLGRWGFQSRGVPVSGPMDWYSHRLANLILENEPSMAALEVTLIGPHIRFEDGGSFAVTGAAFQMTLDDAPIDMNRRIAAHPGAILKFGERRQGARAYIAVAGGVDVPEVLGSRSTHALTKMGGFEGRALKAGDTLAVGRARAESGTDEPGSALPIAQSPLLRIIPADDARLKTHITSQRFRVSPQSDRMGYRLEGVQIDTPAAEIVSTAVPTGAIQVPPAGQPILLMNDHATTGGYAIAGTVITADLPAAGQLAPGDWVRFEACSIDDAKQELRQREAALGCR